MIVQQLKKQPTTSRNGFDQLFNEIVGFKEKGLNFSPKVNSHLPKANIVKSEDSFEIHLSVPGWKKEDFSLTIQNSELSISAKIALDKAEDTKEYTHQEFSKGSFKRVFNLAEDAEQSMITANYENGILRLSIPKNKKAIDREVIKEIKIS
jgi:HSP20 family protein